MRRRARDVRAFDRAPSPTAATANKARAPTRPGELHHLVETTFVPTRGRRASHRLAAHYFSGFTEQRLAIEACDRRASELALSLMGAIGASDR